MISRTRLTLIALILMLSAASHAVLAATSALEGLVTAGPNRAPIANAIVWLRADGLEQRTLTDFQGRYSFPSVETGHIYALTVEAEGLQPVNRANVTVRDGLATRVDILMELAGTEYAVLVVDTLTNARGAEVSQQIDEQAIDELPSVTRSVTKYALLDPHVRQAIGLGADFQDANRLSINAASYRHTGYVLDGVSSYDWIYANGPQVTVSPAAVQEVRVMTGGQYPAQFGLSTTGVVSVVTASGSDRLRGDVFAFVRPSEWQAKPPLSPFEVPNKKFNAGFSAGGPLRARRTYFFGTYERAEQDRGAYIQSPQPGFFTGETREWQALARIDHRATDRHMLTIRANASESATNNANDRVAGFNQPSFGRQSRAESAGGQATHHGLVGAAANELRAAFVAYMPDSARPLQPSVQIARPNYAAEGYSTDNWVRARTFLASDQLTLHRGRHELKVGGEIAWLRAHDYSFTPFGTYTFAPGPPRPDENPTTYSQTFGAVDLRYGQTQGSAFVQDDIRLSPRLTANVGLRYEVQSITDARKNLAPRGGIAWDVAGDGRTIVRGGAGILYDQYYMYLTRRFITLGPQSPQTTLTWSWGDPGFPTFPASFESMPQGRLAGARDIMIPGDELLNPYSRQVSVTLERQIGRDVTLQLSGLDSHTFKQMRVNDINHPEPFVRTAPNQTRTTQAANQSRPFTTYGGVLVRDIAKVENTAESSYRSLDIGVTKRYGGRARWSAHYVWSSSVTYSMFYADANSGVPNEWLPTDDAERGPSDFHQPHRLVADAMLELPFAMNLSMVTVAASGLPVNPITGRDNNGDSYTVDRPVGFARNSFRGPAQFNVDLALAKRLRITSRLRAEARLQVFNLTNRRNFIRVNNIYGEGSEPLPTFLTPVAGITNADPSRQLELVVKLSF